MDCISTVEAFFVLTGEEVSLATKNDLLALIAYRGLGSKWATKTDAAEILECYHDLSWWPVGGRKGPSVGDQTDEEQGVKEEAFEEKLSIVSSSLPFAPMW